eukprot:GILK01003927.1.p1 GENE.GILK01003927.1~~GILK01003927.1.p1  ORF type:complete len:1093 (+),score=213.84 GILK01003927.1:212-3490(+)
MNAAEQQQIEALCECLYRVDQFGEIERRQAQQSLQPLLEDSEHFPKLQYLLDNSQSNYTQVVVANALKSQITKHWSNFTPQQRVDIRNYLLAFLAKRGPSLWPYVITPVIQLIARITKLGWFDEPQHREITQEVTKFLQATADHCILGLQILTELVSDMNLPTKGRTLTQHRKIAVSFRDHSLLHIFQLSLTTIRQFHLQLVKPAEAAPSSNVAKAPAALDWGLRLAKQCLAYDFIGTSSDESSDDVSSVQLPSSWREIVEDPGTVQLFFDVYSTTEPSHASMAMQVLVLLAATRRSIFSSEANRMAHLQRLIGGIRIILKYTQGLQHSDNYHEFCRLLGQIKANYQATELIQCPGSAEFLELAAQFTCSSFAQWQLSSNSLHYLLGLWNRLAAALPYVKEDGGIPLDKYFPLISKSYLEERLKYIEIQAQSGQEDEGPVISEDDQIKEQLEVFSQLIRFKFDQNVHVILTMMDPRLQNYQESLQLLAAEPLNPATRKRVDMLEAQLTWLVWAIGSVMGYRTAGSGNDVNELADGDMSARVFQVMQMTDFKMKNCQSQCDAQLEIAVVFFCQQFRKHCISEPTGLQLTGNHNIAGETVMTSYSKVYLRLCERLGFSDFLAVINLIVTKILTNLKFWTAEERIIQDSIALLRELATGYVTSKQICLKLDSIKFMLTNHTSEHFPFLMVPELFRLRTDFYDILARFWFSDEPLDQLEQYLAPFHLLMIQLMSQPPEAYRRDDVRRTLNGLYRDLRGVINATQHKRNYNAVFEWIYPERFPVIIRTLETCVDEPKVMVPLLKMMAELVHNKTNRIDFDTSSPNGILLFRETSKLIVTYGAWILALGPIPNDSIYAQKYKGVAVCFTMLGRALSGKYVNFGVFALYGDTAFVDVVKTVISLLLSIPPADILAFPKLTKASFTLMEMLFKHHLGNILDMDATVLLPLMAILEDALKVSSDPEICSFCAGAVDNVAVFFFQHRNKENAVGLLCRNILTENPQLLPRFLTLLLNCVIFEDTGAQFSMSKPILPLLLLCEPYFQEYKAGVIMNQPLELQSRFSDAFDRLMKDVERNLELRNRDRFTQNLTAFRHEVKNFQ